MSRDALDFLVILAISLIILCLLIAIADWLLVRSHRSFDQASHERLMKELERHSRERHPTNHHSSK